MNAKADASDLLLVEEANKQAWHRSIFWHGDHPHPDDIDRRRPERQTSASSLLEGAREALKASERMLATARRNVSLSGALSEKACESCRIDLRPFMANAVTGVIKADFRRAISEVNHWHEYVQHYERVASEGQPQVTATPAAVEEWIPF